MPATLTSAARIAANRSNARKSTGPRTAEGKERARANAVRHGMAGAGIALPGEDAAAVEGRFRAIQAELDPRSTLGAALAHQVALMSVRLERAARQEAAALAARVRHAEADFDEARAAEVDALFEAIEADPVVVHRQLLRMPAGVDRLIDRLLDLRYAANLPGFAWTPAEERTLDLLSGRWADSPADLAPPARPIERIDAEVAALRIHRDQLDVEAIDLDRAEAATRALFDPGKAATLARRYEAATLRNLFRALREFRTVEAVADLAEVDQPPAPVQPPVPRASVPVLPTPPASAGIGPKPLSPIDLERTLGSFGDPAPRDPSGLARGATLGDISRPSAGSAVDLTVGVAPRRG